MSVKAATTPTTESSWEQFGTRLKAVFFPSLYLADTSNVSSSSYYSSGSASSTGSASGSNTSFSASGTAASTAGYTCNKTSKTCSYVTANAEYKGTTDTIKNNCNSACKGTSSSSYSGSTSGASSSTGSYSGSSSGYSASGSTAAKTGTAPAASSSSSYTGSSSSSANSSYTSGASTSGFAGSTSPATSGSSFYGGTAASGSATGASTSWQTNTGVAQTQSQTGASWQSPAASTSGSASWQSPAASTSGSASWQTTGNNVTSGANNNAASWTQTGVQSNSVNTGGFSGMLKSIKDLFSPQTVKTDIIQGGLQTTVSTKASDFQDQGDQLLGDKGTEGTECKITSITVSPKKSIYIIGDKVTGKINTSCDKGISVKSYNTDISPEHGQKGGGIYLGNKSTFSFTVDINVISILAKAGQSGKTKLSIASNANFDSKTGETKSVTGEIFITVDLGDEKSATENEDNTKITKKIEFTVDKKEYKTLDDKIKLTITGKPAGMKNCGYNIESDFRNKGYESKNEGVEIKDCTGSILVPVNGAYKIKLSVSGWTTKTNGNMESYTSNPASIEIKYNPKAKETPKEGVNNDCYLEITSMSPNSNKISVTNKQTQDITVKFKLNCTDYNKIDVKPTRVSAYIDIFNLNNEQKESKECGFLAMASNTDTVLPYKQGTEYTITCSSKLLATLPNDARLKLLLVDMYYQTDMETGTEHGTHLARFISTRDRVEIVTNGTNGDKKDDGKIVESITLSASPNVLATGENYYLTATGTVGDKALCAIWSSSSDNKIGWWWEHGNMSFNDMSKSVLPKYNFVKSTAKSEFLQVRCADNNTKYYSNTVVVKLASTETWGEICRKTPCKGTYVYDKQITPVYTNGKITGIKAFNFGATLSGDKCNLATFQKNFVRLKIDDKIILDKTIPTLTKTVTTSVNNLWSLLSEKTKNTLNNGGIIEISVEAWGTFDEIQAKTNKKVNCNWGEEIYKITIKKETSGTDLGNSKTTTTKTIITKTPVEIAACKKTCKVNFDKLPEEDMIKTYGGNSKQEAYTNCVYICDGKEAPYKTTAKTIPAASTGKITENIILKVSPEITGDKEPYVFTVSGTTPPANSLCDFWIVDHERAAAWGGASYDKLTFTTLINWLKNNEHKSTWGVGENGDTFQIRCTMPNGDSYISNTVTVKAKESSTSFPIIINSNKTEASPRENVTFTVLANTLPAGIDCSLWTNLGFINWSTGASIKSEEIKAGNAFVLTKDLVGDPSKVQIRCADKTNYYYSNLVSIFLKK